ncbi:hypothetical protein JYU34_000834 [Plutella xylostella]|uniref:Uncharacterized protein n=2 Tax=Plutella xylostella TaxID=51655 RepID=A0ABQ7R8N8_PLUXY|nr:hypothetical protein JYU34_000834 [Plutella xylostella]
MVRDKFKMVPRPFSGDGQLLWSGGRARGAPAPGAGAGAAAPDRAVYRSQRPRTILAQERRRPRARHAPPRPATARDGPYSDVSIHEQDTLFPTIREEQAPPSVSSERPAGPAGAAAAEGDEEAPGYPRQAAPPAPAACACADVLEANTTIDLEDIYSRIDLQASPRALLCS